MKIGNRDVKDIRVGSSYVNRVYQGSNLTWERAGEDQMEERVVVLTFEGKIQGNLETNPHVATSSSGNTLVNNLPTNWTFGEWGTVAYANASTNNTTQLATNNGTNNQNSRVHHMFRWDIMRAINNLPVENIINLSANWRARANIGSTNRQIDLGAWIMTTSPPTHFQSVTNNAQFLNTLTVTLTDQESIQSALNLTGGALVLRASSQSRGAVSGTAVIQLSTAFASCTVRFMAPVGFNVPNSMSVEEFQLFQIRQELEFAESAEELRLEELRLRELELKQKEGEEDE